jgi:hypothetical protein
VIHNILALLPASWRTTTCGLLGLAAYLAAMCAFLVPPEHQARFEDTMHAISTLCLTAGLVLARDKGVSTEQEQAKKGER